MVISPNAPNAHELPQHPIKRPRNAPTAPSKHLQNSTERPQHPLKRPKHIQTPRHNNNACITTLQTPPTPIKVPQYLQNNPQHIQNEPPNTPFQTPPSKHPLKRQKHPSKRAFGGSGSLSSHYRVYMGEEMRVDRGVFFKDSV